VAETLRFRDKVSETTDQIAKIMATFRHFLAVSIASAIAFNFVEPGASQTLRSQAQYPGNLDEGGNEESLGTQAQIRRILYSPFHRVSPLMFPLPKRQTLNANARLLPEEILRRLRENKVELTLEVVAESQAAVEKITADTQDSSNEHQPEQQRTVKKQDRENHSEPTSMTAADRPSDLPRSGAVVGQGNPSDRRTPNVSQLPAVEDTPRPVAPVEPGSLELLSPASNPLAFPTIPEEVDVEVVQPITLEQALELARRNNRDLQVAELTLERARLSLREAQAERYPDVGTSVDLTRVDSGSGTRLGQIDPVFGVGADQDSVRTTLGAGLELNYDLYTAGRRPAAIRAAEAGVRLQQLEVERLSEQLRLDVSNDYYDLQQSDEQVRIAQASVSEAARSLRDAELLEEAGLGTRFDVLRAQVELANNRQDLTNASAQLQITRRQLVESLNLAQFVEVTAADPIEVAGVWELALEESIVLAYRNRAELEQQLVQREINQQQRQIALSATRPQASVFSSYNIQALISDDNGPVDSFRLGARLLWNFFDGGAARARARQEEKNIAIAEARFADQRDQIRLDVEQAYYNLQANQENIQTASLAVTQAEESLRLARLRFQAGVGTQTDVIATQTELTRAQVNLLNAILNYNRSLSSLQRSVSNLPDGNLSDVP
jgi:outer membrane protein TolC